MGIFQINSANRSFLVYFRLPMRFAAFLIAVVFIAACRPESYSPKPRGYARIDTPEHAYQRFSRADFPYTFEYPTYSLITRDTVMAGMRPDNPYWINLELPGMNGTIYLSYKVIDAAHPLDRLLNDAHEISYFHTKRADYINAPEFHTGNNVHGVLYTVGGNAASPYQFFATDSTRHFLRGSLYFNITPNADSLRPLTEFLHTDIVRLLNTLKWQDGTTLNQKIR